MVKQFRLQLIKISSFNYLLVYHIMKLDPQKMKEAIMEMTKDYKLDPATVMEIVKLGIKTAYKKDYVIGDKKLQLLVKI